MPPSPELEDSAPRQRATIYLTAADLANDPGPLTTTRYAVVLALGPEVFRWVYADATTADNINVIGTNGIGGVGRWHRTRTTILGTNLPNTDTTILVSGNRLRVIAPSTLSGNRIYTLGTTGAVAGDEIWIARNDTSAFTATIVNGGAGAGNVAVMPVSVRSWATAHFDGTNFVHKGSGLSLATA